MLLRCKILSLKPQLKRTFDPGFQVRARVADDPAVGGPGEDDLDSSERRIIGRQRSRAKPYFQRHQQSEARPTCRARGRRVVHAPSFRVKEIGDDILGFPIGVTAAERHEDDFEAIESRTVPTSVFADERAAAIFLRQTVGGIKNKSERGNVRTQRIIGNNRLSRPDPGVAARRADQGAGRSNCRASHRSRWDSRRAEFLPDGFVVVCADPSDMMADGLLNRIAKLAGFDQAGGLFDDQVTEIAASVSMATLASFSAMPSSEKTIGLFPFPGVVPGRRSAPALRMTVEKPGT